MTAGWQYNNPGDVSLGKLTQGWGGYVVGLPGQPGFSGFPSMEAGYGAFNQLFDSYVARGQDTIAKLNTTYATDTNWGAGVSKLSGVGLNEPITASNAADVQYGILRQEGLSGTQADFAQDTFYDSGFGGSGASLADSGAAPYSPSYDNPAQAYGMPSDAATAPPSTDTTSNYIGQGGYGPYPQNAQFGLDSNIPGAGGSQPMITAPGPGEPAIAMPNTATDPSAALANGSAGYQLPNGIATAAPAPVAIAGGPSGAIGSGSGGLGGTAATSAPTSMRANSLSQSTAQSAAGGNSGGGGGGPSGMWEMVGASAVDYAGNTTSEATKKLASETKTAGETVKSGLGDVQKSVEELNKGVAQDTSQITTSFAKDTAELTSTAEKGYGTAANLVGDIQGTSSSFLVRWALIGAGFIVLWAGFRMATAGAK
jgi:hypothetical protein